MADVFGTLVSSAQTTVQYLGHILGVLVEIDKKLGTLIELLGDADDE